jgi:GntR family transcriptional regulator, rspAB operon transcriptional repressor
MDRIRMLSLNSSSQRLALNEHIAILEAIRARDPEAAAAAMNRHLSRILILIEEIKAENHAWFTDIAA